VTFIGCVQPVLLVPHGGISFIEGMFIISHWQNELSIPSLIKHEPSPQPTHLSFIRTGLEGRVTGYTEVLLS